MDSTYEKGFTNGYNEARRDCAEELRYLIGLTRQFSREGTFHLIGEIVELANRLEDVGK